MMRLRFSFIGMLAMAIAVLLMAAETSLAQRRGGSRGGGDRGGRESRGGDWRGGDWRGGDWRGYYPGGYYRGWSYPGYYDYGYGYNRWYRDGYYYPGRRYYDYYDYGTDYAEPYYDSGAYRSDVPAESSDASSSTAAVLNITVPPDAEIWVQGVKMSGSGTRRQFASPPLEQGEDYEYKIQARWMENGREVARTRTVDVHAGDRLNVDLTKPGPTK